MVSGIENEGVIEKMKLGEKNSVPAIKTKRKRGNHNVRKCLHCLQPQAPGPSGPGNDLGLAVQDEVAEDKCFFLVKLSGHGGRASRKRFSGSLRKIGRMN